MSDERGRTSQVAHRPQHVTGKQAADCTSQVARDGPHVAHCTSHVTLFIIELTYRAPLAQIDATMAAHMRFLKKYYASGHFLVSGRKIPRDGGIILAAGDSREEMEAIAREDPFCARRLADFRVVEFRVSQRAEDIQERIDR